MKEIDYLQLYFGKEYVVNDKISIHHPTIGEIADYGEREYFSMVHALTAISSDFKPELEDNKIEYEKVTDLEMFYMMSKYMPVEQTGILFGQVDFTKLVPIMQENDELLLYGEKQGIRIDRHVHAIMMQFLLRLHDIVKKPEFAANRGTREFMIEDDRMRKKVASRKPYESMLLPLCSAMVNSAGFKYSSKQVLDVKLFEFFDSVRRIGVIQSSTALLQGGYSGMADLSKVPKESFNWCRDLYKPKR